MRECYIVSRNIDSLYNLPSSRLNVSECRGSQSCSCVFFCKNDISIRSRDHFLLLLSTNDLNSHFICVFEWSIVLLNLGFFFFFVFSAVILKDVAHFSIKLLIDQCSMFIVLLARNVWLKIEEEKKLESVFHKHDNIIEMYWDVL